MMINKVKLYGWLAALLLVVNIATIATIFYQIRDEDLNEVLVIEPDSPGFNGRYFRHQLGFDATQMEQFRVANRQFRTQANLIISSINEQKQAMYAQLTADQPSDEEIQRIATQIGHQHQALKMETARFYLALRQIATPEQQQRLEKIFEPLFRTIPPSSAGNCQGQRGAQRRGGRNVN